MLGWMFRRGATRRPAAVALIGLICVVLAAVTVLQLTGSGDDPRVVTIVGAGDIAACGRRSSARTAALVEKVIAARPTARVVTFGDNANPDGTDEDFACFDATWGRWRDRMLPTVGNREYETPGAAGYFRYFGETAAPPGGWYAVDVGEWRLYGLNSECQHVDCTADSEQVRWLRADLAANPRACVVAMWHEPRFNSGPHGPQYQVQPFWDALYAAGAELVFNGHAHDYERFDPVDPTGALDPEHGIREIIVGTGGDGGAEFGEPHPASVVREGQTWGVIELTLRPDRYDWRFHPIDGETFTDSGSGVCHSPPDAGPGASPDPQGSPAGAAAVGAGAATDGDATAEGAALVQTWRPV
jgi:hypothetical protein